VARAASIVRISSDRDMICLPAASEAEELAAYLFVVIVEHPVQIVFSGGFLRSLRLLDTPHERMSLPIFV
jgi:hypothetical protein